MISVIFPVHDNEKTLVELHRRLVAALSGLNEPYEIIAVDNGSTDHSRERLAELTPLTTVLFSKYFGTNAALDAGFKIAIGDFIVTIDGGFATVPEDIPAILQQLRSGYGTVVSRRAKRREGLVHTLFSRCANRLVSVVTGVRVHDLNSPLKGYRREFIDGIQLLGNTFIFMPIFAAARGARIAEVSVQAGKGQDAPGSDSIFSMAHFLFDLISVKFLLNYFSNPLRFFGSWAFGAFLLAILAFGWSLFLKLLGTNDFTATPLPVIAAMFVILSVILFMLGFVTEILLRIYYDRKDNAPYMIYEVVKNKK